MADIYKRPEVAPPADPVLDDLDARAKEVFVTVDTVAATVIREQRVAIRRLRVALAQVQANRDSIVRIANIARDERVAQQCPGSGLPPSTVSEHVPPKTPKGFCSACNQEFFLARASFFTTPAPLWVVPDHAVPTL